MATLLQIYQVSAGVLAGAVIGPLFVLVAGIGILMTLYRRRWHQTMGIPGHISPLLKQYASPELGGSSVIDIAPNDTIAAPQEKRRHTHINHVLISPVEPASNESEIPQSNLCLCPGSPSQVSPTSAWVSEDVAPDDVRAQVASLNVRMETTIERMVERIHRLESQLDQVEDGHSDAPPPTYISL